MPLYWSMKARWSVNVPGTVVDVTAHLRRAIENRDLVGAVTDTGFAFSGFRHRKGRNSWRPRMEGVFVPEVGGTRVDVVAKVHPFVFAFTLVHSLAMFGIAWLVGTAAFSSEVPRARAVLEEALRGEAPPPI